jgi:hypothetical protein
MVCNGARVYNDLCVSGGDDKANVLHTGCVFGEHVFELDTPISANQSPNAHTAIIAAADDVRTQCILARRSLVSMDSR